MTGRRTTTLLTGLLVAALAGTSFAARQKPVCNLLTDPAADAATPVGPSTSLDIVSADIASDGVDLTAVVRVAKYADPDTSSPIGRRWVVTFTLPGQDTTFYLRTTNDPVLLAPTYDFGVWGAPDPAGRPTYVRGGNLAGKVDAARNEVRMHIALSDFNKYGVALQPRSLIRSLKAHSFAMSNNYYSAHDLGSDSGQTAAGYEVGRASCVKVGL